MKTTFSKEIVQKHLVNVLQFGCIGNCGAMTVKKRGELLNYLIDDLKYLKDNCYQLTENGLKYTLNFCDKYAK